MATHIDVLFPTLFRVLSDATDEVMINYFESFFFYSPHTKNKYSTDEHLSHQGNFGTTLIRM